MDNAGIEGRNFFTALTAAAQFIADKLIQPAVVAVGIAKCSGNDAVRFDFIEYGFQILHKASFCIRRRLTEMLRVEIRLFGQTVGLRAAVGGMNLVLIGFVIQARKEALCARHTGIGIAEERHLLTRNPQHFHARQCFTQTRIAYAVVAAAVVAVGHHHHMGVQPSTGS